MVKINKQRKTNELHNWILLLKQGDQRREFWWTKVLRNDFSKRNWRVVSESEGFGWERGGDGEFSVWIWQDYVVL